ncbi:hypothetical protein A2U01_0019966, partial [Trifolium medium]|nr:hypothetical protein [Trifolium medium]
HHRKLWKEAKDRGEEYKITTLKRNIEMDEYDFMHWRRSFEEREALIRDISCRKTLGLPLEEPGRYVDASFFGKDKYDPESPLYRYDYWGEPKNSEKSRKERMTDTHNQSIVGKGTVWFEMPYEDSIIHQPNGQQVDEYTKQGEGAEEEEDDDDDDDFDLSILSSLGNNVSDQIHVNGTETSRLSEGLFEE